MYTHNLLLQSSQCHHPGGAHVVVLHNHGNNTMIDEYMYCCV